MKREWVLIFIFLLFLSLNFFYFKNSLKNFFFSLSKPFFLFFDSLTDSFNFLLERLKTNERLAKENVSCFERLNFLEAKLVEKEELKRENEFLRNALNLGFKEKRMDLLLAQVIAVFPFEDKILIDRGKKDGVSENMFVVLENFALVGEIEKVFDDFSVVSLISNKNFSLAGRIEGKEIFGLIKGEGNGNVFLEKIFIENDQKIEGQDIVVSWLSERMPNNLLVGKIKSFSGNLSEKVKIEPYYLLRKIDLVFVVKSFKK